MPGSGLRGNTNDHGRYSAQQKYCAVAIDGEFANQVSYYAGDEKYDHFKYDELDHISFYLDISRSHFKTPFPRVCGFCKALSSLR